LVNFSFGTGGENSGTGNGFGYGGSGNENNGNGYGSTVLTIPIFTVTVNPLEADEMTYVPDSPTDFPVHKKSGNSGGRKSQSEIANMTIIVDDVDSTTKMLSDGYDSDEVM